MWCANILIWCKVYLYDNLIYLYDVQLYLDDLPICLYNVQIYFISFMICFDLLHYIMSKRSYMMCFRRCYVQGIAGYQSFDANIQRCYTLHLVSRLTQLWIGDTLQNPKTKWHTSCRNKFLHPKKKNFRKNIRKSELEKNHQVKLQVTVQLWWINKDNDYSVFFLCWCSWRPARCIVISYRQRV